MQMRELSKMVSVQIFNFQQVVETLLNLFPNFAGQLICPFNLSWLVVSNIFSFPFHIWVFILPIDELHHF